MKAAGNQENISPADIIIAKISFWCLNFFFYPNNLSLSVQVSCLYRFLVVLLSKLRIFEQCNVQNWYSFSNFASHFTLSYPQRRICIELKEMHFFLVFSKNIRVFSLNRITAAFRFLCIIFKDVNKKIIFTQVTFIYFILWIFVQFILWIFFSSFYSLNFPSFILVFESSFPPGENIQKNKRNYKEWIIDESNNRQEVVEKHDRLCLKMTR